MKLKKLEISGFKSFHEKTSLHFPPGILAIVGPNGCGKSNVMDALRWVMGEQSVRQLRGKAMEDVIFAGSSGKASLNVAEVSLTLINDAESAPEALREFSEIMLTRRLYRSGDSMYLINRQPCRLKDIHQVFMGSGMGAKSYALIQQGNIGAITEAGPEERRGYIEEAAGITRYKASKVEALRKLEGTKQNLLRLMDIIAEIQHQMASLERQAKKAEAYRGYQKKIQQLDIRLHLLRYQMLQAEIQQKKTLLETLNDQDAGHLSRTAQLEAAAASIRLTHLQLNQKIMDRQNRKQDCHRQADRLENNVAHLKSDVTRLTEECMTLDAARSDLESQTARITDEISEIEAQQQSLQEDIFKASEALKAVAAGSQEAQSRLKDTEKERDALNARLMELSAQEARYQHVCEHASTSRDALRRRLKRVDEDVYTATREVSEHARSEAEARNELTGLQEEAAQLSKDIEALKQELDTAASALGLQVKQVQTLNVEKAGTTSRWNALRKMADNYEWYNAGVRAVMQQARKPESELAGISGLVAEILEPDPSYEMALEIALGEALQYLLVDTPETGLHTIAWLRGQGAGRCGCIPLSAVQSRAGITEPGPDTLRHHVRVTPGYESLAAALLGDIAVADTLENALRVQTEVHPEHLVVTRDGQMVSERGVLIGGSPQSTSGILSRKKEMADMEATLQRIADQIASARNVQTDMETRVRDMETRLQKMLAQRQELSQDALQMEKQLFQASEKLKQARKRLELSQLEQEQLSGEESDMDDAIVRDNAVLARIREDMTSVRTSITDLSAAMERLSQEMTQVRQDEVDIQLQLTTGRAQFDNNAGALKRLKEFRQDGLRRISGIDDDVAAKRRKIADSIQKADTGVRQLDELRRQIDAITQELDAEQNAYADADRRLKEAEHDIGDIHHQRDAILQQIRRLEPELSQFVQKQAHIGEHLTAICNKSIAEIQREVAASAEAGGSMSLEDMEAELAQYRMKIARLGDVNLESTAEYEALKSRCDFLETQRQDMVKAEDDLHKLIRKINRITQERFMETFQAINEKIQDVFSRLFEGGSAQLILTEPEKPLETGVEFMIQPPGKKLTRISLLSGGEKTLSGIAFIFSIFLIKPAAFCLMDEIDAPLDESNVFRFNGLLKLIGENSQIVMITHNKHSMEFADTLIGITMEQKGVSKVVSVNMAAL